MLKFAFNQIDKYVLTLCLQGSKEIMYNRFSSTYSTHTVQEKEANGSGLHFLSYTKDTKLY